MAANLGLHMPFGPIPSVEMVLTELARKAQEAQLLLPMKNPVVNPCPNSPELDSWDLALDNPNWGNNAEASTSSRYKRPRL